MREFILNQGEALERSQPFPVLRRRLRNWWARRQLAVLENLDDHVLKDIGLTRADVQYVLSQPLDLDPARELGRLVIHNRRTAHSRA